MTINRSAINYLMRPGLRGYANGGPVFDARQGGLVPPGLPGRDTVPAMTSGGPAMLDSNRGYGNQEYVLPADTVSKVGIGTLDALKNATHTPGGPTSSGSRMRSGLPGFQDGGVTYGAWKPVKNLAERVQQRRQRAVYGRAGTDVPRVGNREIADRPAPNTRYTPGQRATGSLAPKPIPRPGQRGAPAANLQANVMPWEAPSAEQIRRSAFPGREIISDTPLMPRTRPGAPGNTEPAIPTAASPSAVRMERILAEGEGPIREEMAQYMNRQARQAPSVGVLPEGVRRRGETGIMLAEQEQGFSGARPVTLVDRILSLFAQAGAKRAHAIAHPQEQRQLAQARREERAAARNQAPAAPEAPAQAPPPAGQTGLVPAGQLSQEELATGPQFPAGTERMTLDLLGGAQREAYKSLVPTEGQEEFGKAIYGGTPEMVQPGALPGPAGGFAAPTDDYYGGYDLSGMSPSERMAFKQSLNQEASDMRAAQAYMALPEDMRGTFNPGSAVGEAVARGMGRGPSPSMQQVAALEERGREALAARQNTAAEREMEALKQAGAEELERIRGRAGVAAERAKQPPAPDFGQVPEFTKRLQKAEKDLASGKGSQAAVDSARTQYMAALAQTLQRMRALQELGGGAGMAGLPSLTPEELAGI